MQAALWQITSSEAFALANYLEESWINLFVGDIDAGSRIAGLYTLVATCKARGINPFAYLADTIPRVRENLTRSCGARQRRHALSTAHSPRAPGATHSGETSIGAHQPAQR